MVGLIVMAVTDLYSFGAGINGALSENRGRSECADAIWVPGGGERTRLEVDRRRITGYQGRVCGSDE